MGRPSAAPLAPSLRDALRDIVGPHGVITDAGPLATYEHDGFMVKARPLAVCLPTTTPQVASLLRLAAAEGLPVTPRGAGTGLSGGATSVGGGLVIGTSRMNRILHLDPQNQRATVQPGVVNADLSRAAEPYGLAYAPDPSSQTVSTIGGNVAENAGGPHCLAYGVTTNHVLSLEAVTAAGEVVTLGGPPDAVDAPGLDLTGLVTGSEGNLAFVTRATVRLRRRMEAVSTLLALFDSVAAAGLATSAVIAAGILPAALEFVDATTISALRQGGFSDYPAGAAAVLLIELEGLAEQTAEETARVQDVLLAHGATEVRAATAAAERARLWAGRKGALGAFGRLAPNYYIQDGVVPRSRLVEVLIKVQAIARRESLLIANVFHAGDGNLHPTILYDARTPGLTERVVEAGAEILRCCIDAGGTLSGEHGVGLEKQAYLDWVFAPVDRAAQQAVKRAWDPALRLNPGKPFSGPLADSRPLVHRP
ncbi:MAG: FAD-binding protein [Chloroflexota bacterium]|nr:FAD-binding protein [Chloroflexota bacterium]